MSMHTLLDYPQHRTRRLKRNETADSSRQEIDRPPRPTQRFETNPIARNAMMPAKDAKPIGRSWSQADDMSSSFEELIAAFRHLEHSLRYLHRCTAHARCDPLLLEHCRDLECDCREESRRLTRQIGREAIRLARKDDRNGSERQSPRRDTMTRAGVTMRSSAP